MKWLDKFSGGGLLGKIISSLTSAVKKAMNGDSEATQMILSLMNSGDLQSKSILQAVKSASPELFDAMTEIADQAASLMELGGVVEYFHSLKKGGRLSKKDLEDKVKTPAARKLFKERKGGKLTEKDLKGKIKQSADLKFVKLEDGGKMKPNMRKYIHAAKGTTLHNPKCATCLKRDGGRIIEVNECSSISKHLLGGWLTPAIQGFIDRWKTGKTEYTQLPNGYMMSNTGISTKPMYESLTGDLYSPEGVYQNVTIGSLATPKGNILGAEKRTFEITILPDGRMALKPTEALAKENTKKYKEESSQRAATQAWRESFGAGKKGTYGGKTYDEALALQLEMEDAKLYGFNVDFGGLDGKWGQKSQAAYEQYKKWMEEHRANIPSRTIELKPLTIKQTSISTRPLGAINGDTRYGDEVYRNGVWEDIPVPENQIVTKSVPVQLVPEIIISRTPKIDAIMLKGGYKKEGGWLSKFPVKGQYGTKINNNFFGDSNWGSVSGNNLSASTQANKTFTAGNASASASVTGGDGGTGNHGGVGGSAKSKIGNTIGGSNYDYSSTASTAGSISNNLTDNRVVNNKLRNVGNTKIVFRRGALGNGIAGLAGLFGNQLA